VIKATENEKPARLPAAEIGMLGTRAGYVYTPLDDITAAEMAQVAGMLQLWPMVAMRVVPQRMIDLAYERMTPGARRHFTVELRPAITIPTVVVPGS